MNILITLTSAGTDTGPFNLYSNVDNYTTAFETNISKGILVAGYTTTLAPTGTTTVRVLSMGTCSNYVNIPVIGLTTTTTTSTVAPTTTTTTTYVGPSTTTTTTTGAPGPTTTTTTTPYVGPATTTTTTTSGGGGETTTTTTTSIITSCEEWRNDTAGEVVITYTPCGSGTPVSNYAVATTSSVCAVYGSVTIISGDPLTLVGSCSVSPTTTTTTTTPAPEPTTTTTTTSPAPEPTTTTTTTAAPVYYVFSLTNGAIDSSTACADSTPAVTVYGSNISFLSNATFYSDYTLSTPYDGGNLYYKNVSNNEYVQISSIGSQTAAGSC